MYAHQPYFVFRERAYADAKPVQEWLDGKEKEDASANLPYKTVSSSIETKGRGRMTMGFKMSSLKIQLSTRQDRTHRPALRVLFIAMRMAIITNHIMPPLAAREKTSMIGSVTGFRIEF